MKGPNKKSKQDYSSIVTLLCITLGVILIGIVVIPVINNIIGKIFATAIYLSSIALLGWSTIYEVKRIKEEEKEDK